MRCAFFAFLSGFPNQPPRMAPIIGLERVGEKRHSPIAFANSAPVVARASPPVFGTWPGRRSHASGRGSAALRYNLRY
jgi:hypothetical protein